MPAQQEKDNLSNSHGHLFLTLVPKEKRKEKRHGNEKEMEEELIYPFLRNQYQSWDVTARQK
jgi:hypothetical protein